MKKEKRKRWNGRRKVGEAIFFGYIIYEQVDHFQTFIINFYLPATLDSGNHTMAFVIQRLWLFIYCKNAISLSLMLQF